MGIDREPLCMVIDGVDPIFVPAMLKQFMACQYQRALPKLSYAEALDAAVATWGSDWSSDPAPRTYDDACVAVEEDLEHWESE